MALERPLTHGRCRNVTGVVQDGVSVTRPTYVVSDVILEPNGGGMVLVCGAGDWDKPLAVGDTVAIEERGARIRKMKLTEVDVRMWRDVLVARLRLRRSMPVSPGAKVWLDTPLRRDPLK
jgi:hypothetical protein